jgi:Putative zinc-finger
MKVDHQCRWVRHRLPLLAGGELGVEERRRVERHLIGCLGCQDRREESTNALTVLRSFAEVAPAKTDAPSLWPALAVQIRQSRHVDARPSWWEIPLSRPWFAFNVAVGFGLVLAAGFMQPSIQEQATPAPAVTIQPEVIEPPAILAYSPSPRRALPDTPARPAGALPQGADGQAEPPSGLLFNYDLDHMTPMSSSNRDPQHSY